MSEQQVRYRLRAGRLEYAVQPHLIAVESVRALFPDDSLRELRECVLQRLLAREVQAPVPTTRYAKHSIHELIAATLVGPLLPRLPEWWRKSERSVR